MRHVFATLFALAVPFLTYAQASYGCSTFVCLMSSAGMFISLRIISVLVGLALVAFFYGIARYIYAAREGAELDKAKGILVWSVIALFVMFSIGGIVVLLQRTLNVDPNSRLPQLEESYFRYNN